MSGEATLSEERCAPRVPSIYHAMNGEPIHQQDSGVQAPAAALQTELQALCDLLILKPLPERPVLRDRVLSALAACERAQENGLVAHLLRNLLRDLAPRSASVDAAYYAALLGAKAGRPGR